MHGTEAAVFTCEPCRLHRYIRVDGLATLQIFFNTGGEMTLEITMVLDDGIPSVQPIYYTAAISLINCC